MSYEPLDPKDYEPMTQGMCFSVAGDKARAVYDLERGRDTGVTFSHNKIPALPDDELLQLAQLNITPPPDLLGEIAKRGLNGKFRDLWQAGKFGGSKI